jgi:hypothetical protein
MPKQLNAAGSAAGASYIVGTGEGFNKIEYMQDGTTRSALGRKDDKPINHSIDDRIQAVDITLGENDAGKQNNHYSIKDRNYPVASGYSTKGVPTYGSGPVLTTITYANDTTDDKANVKFEYGTQAGPTGVKYSSLAS